MPCTHCHSCVVYDVKDTNFEWNSQLRSASRFAFSVVCDVKDTNFEWTKITPTAVLADLVILV